MPYNHGVRVLEKPTSAVAPILGTAGLQVVFGTAPINLAANPYGVTNVPVLCYTWDEAVTKLGYSDDYEKYTLCASMYASFQLFQVAPVIFINVLDPAVHKKANQAQDVTVESLQATVQVAGILPASVDVKMVTGSGESEQTTALAVNTDYPEFPEKSGSTFYILSKYCCWTLYFESLVSIVHFLDWLSCDEFLIINNSVLFMQSHKHRLCSQRRRF